MKPALPSKSTVKNPVKSNISKQREAGKNKAVQEEKEEKIPIQAFRRMTLHDSKAKSKKSPSVLRTQTIHFTQASVAENFADGRTVANLTTQLINGAITPEDIEPIRVVSYKNKWMSLDNRRLRAFKDAFVEEIPIVVCNLSVPDIKKEFYAKFSNKSSQDGGTLRSRPQSDSKEHFEEGAFKFTKRVLTWNFEQLKTHLPGLREKPLRRHFQAKTYYSKFLDLILEEARASLQAGIESVETHNINPINLSLLYFKRSNNAQNPSTFTFYREGYDDSLIKAYDAFILQIPSESPEVSPLRMLALAGAAPAHEKNQVKLKVIVEQDLQQEHSDSFFKKDAKWQAIPIGSLVTHLRMYDVCTAEPKISWLEELCTAKLQDSSAKTDMADEKETFAELNEPQKKAIGKFLNLKQGLQLVQGPPGTGKTTTIITLLKILAKQKQRVLVCAPSNKAVQVLVERFINESPDIPIILAGVEDKLPDDNPLLRDVFIHTWGPTKLNEVRQMREQLWKLTPDKLFSGKKADAQKNIKTAKETVKALRINFKKFRAAFHKYGFKPTSSDNLNQLRNALKQYDEAINDPSLQSALDQYYSNFQEINCKEPTNIAPELLAKFQHLRQLLSQCVGVFNNLELRLQAAIDNDTKQGLEGILLDRAQLIFCTLSVSGRKAMKEMDAVDALVVDEAGQTVEAETLIPLTARPKKCLLIGDTKQLPATVISPKAVELKFHRSLMWRLLEDCQQPHSMLTIQFRMHTEIRRWPSAQYYQDKLSDGKEINEGRWSIPTMASAPTCFAPYALIDIPGREIRTGHSFKNVEEAQFIAKVLAYLQKNHQIDPRRQVGIITFYKAQADLLNQMLRRDFPGIKANTVDSFQGSEKDFIFISFVRSNERGSIGFLNDFRRLNVALTRAKFGLIMFGNTALLEKQEHDVSSLIKDARARKCLFQQQQVETYLQPKTAPAKKSQSKHGQFFKKPKNSTQPTKQAPLAVDEKPIKQSKPSTVLKTPVVSTRKQQPPREEKTTITKPTQPKSQTPASAKPTALSANNPLYKTELCRFFSKSPASCHKGEKCDFAHGKQELRIK